MSNLDLFGLSSEPEDSDAKKGTESQAQQSGDERVENVQKTVEVQTVKTNLPEKKSSKKKKENPTEQIGELPVVSDMAEPESQIVDESQVFEAEPLTDEIQDEELVDDLLQEYQQEIMESKPEEKTGVENNSIYLEENYIADENVQNSEDESTNEFQPVFEQENNLDENSVDSIQDDIAPEMDSIEEHVQEVLAESMEEIIDNTSSVEFEEKSIVEQITVEPKKDNRRQEEIIDSLLSSLKSEMKEEDIPLTEEPKKEEKKADSNPIPVYISKEIRKKRGEVVEEHEDQMPLANFDPLAVYKGMVRRFFIISRHTVGLFAGGLISFRKALPKSRTKGLRFLFTRMAAAITRPLVMKDLRDKPFAFQLRRRLELMGPTYIKLGQILALREDILPDSVTEELKNLLDRLPPIDFKEILEIVQNDLGRPIGDCFKEINKKPIGTASIAQTHLAITVDDERVVLKVVKPGIRDSILTDIRLLKLISGFLQWAIPQYQPKQLIDEFCAYTEKEVDLTNEADHAEIFAANFREHPLVKFPRIYREYSGLDVLCMEFMDGYKPGAPETESLTLEERESLVDTGAASIIQMLYKDGFFHADLHPGNLMILPGPKLGFIDLGMVGRFEDKTRRRMLYYFHALVSGDIDGATKYLLAMARVGQGGDPQGFRRAVSDTLRRYYMHAQSGDFSLGQLILNSLSIGGKYRVFFPVEMTLMVKALVTFEGVGFLLLDKLDVPKLSEKYVTKIFKEQFNPANITKELLRGAPELVDMLVQLPKLSADGLKFLEETLNDRSPSNPLEGIKSAIIAGACLVGGVLALIQGAHWGVYSVLFGLSILFAMFGK
ncbi:hypothetical protein EP331_07530 [bacterium]|nr:MAG: hypothetical protein EP331_07530 [bacterium]